MYASKCQELMNEGLDLHRTKTDPAILKAIGKYKEALEHIPEKGKLTYPDSGHFVIGGDNIRSEIYTHLAYAYQDLGDLPNEKNAYDKALEYNPNNVDAKEDRKIPHGLRQRFDNQGASGAAAKYPSGGSLLRVIITCESNERPEPQRIFTRQPCGETLNPRANNQGGIMNKLGFQAPHQMSDEERRKTC